MGLIDSYSEANSDTQFVLGSGVNTRIGQSFTGNGAPLDSAMFYLKIATGTPAGNLTASIYTHSGVFGTSSVGTGAALATSDVVPASTLTGSFALIEFTFTGVNRITPTNATKYIVAVEDSSADASHNEHVGVDQTSPTHAGNSCYYDGAVWTADNAYDVIFYANSFNYRAAYFYRRQGFQ